MADLETIRAAKSDPALFAKLLVGQPLWDHQRAVLASPARLQLRRAAAECLPPSAKLSLGLRRMGLRCRRRRGGRVRGSFGLRRMPELFELEFVEHDPTDPDNPRLVINLLFEVVNEAVQLREVIADPLEVPEALDHLRARRSMNEWKRIALMTLAAKLAEAALEASGRPYDEDGAAIVGEAIRRAHRTPIAQRRDRITSEHLAAVARVYREAWNAGEHPTIAVQDHFGVSHSTAARWVGKARRADHLGRPAEGSRGGEGQRP